MSWEICSGAPSRPTTYLFIPVLSVKRASPTLPFVPLSPPPPLRNLSQDINSIYNVLELLQGRARSTEALVMVKLDIARNRILTAGLVFSMASSCFTLGTLVSGIFGG